MTTVLNLDRSYRAEQKRALDGRIKQAERLLRWMLISFEVSVGVFIAAVAAMSATLLKWMLVSLEVSAVVFMAVVATKAAKAIAKKIAARRSVKPNARTSEAA